MFEDRGEQAIKLYKYSYKIQLQQQFRARGQMELLYPFKPELKFAISHTSKVISFSGKLKLRGLTKRVE